MLLIFLQTINLNKLKNLPPAIYQKLNNHLFHALLEAKPECLLATAMGLLSIWISQFQVLLIKFVEM